MKPIIAITHGDTNGIGYEVIFKTFAVPEMLDICTPVIYGSAKVAKYHLNALGIEANINIINSAQEFHHGKINLIPVVDEVKVEFGQSSEDSCAAAQKALDQAMADFKEGFFDALVTAPANASNDEADESLMILVNPRMRVALATTHCSVSEIAGKITTELLERKIETLNKSLKQDFRILQPRIAVLSLNPHAGEDGLLGKEEQEIITPAIKNMMEKKVLCYGPFPADDFFGQATYQHFDAVLAMYHDQGLAPFKALSAGEGINFTAGLPLVQTAPDHGAEYGIAGKNEADETSFRQAVYSAIDIMRSRRDYAEAYSNPLPKLFHERRDEGERLRFNIPAKKQKDDKNKKDTDN